MARYKLTANEANRLARRDELLLAEADIREIASRVTDAKFGEYLDMAIARLGVIRKSLL